MGMKSTVEWEFTFDEAAYWYIRYMVCSVEGNEYWTVTILATKIRNAGIKALNLVNFVDE